MARLRVAVLGLGEAGSALASDLLQAGAEVVGYDPVPEKDVPGILRAQSEREAAFGAQVVLSVNWARVALEVAGKVAPVLAPGAVYADLNTAPPPAQARPRRSALAHRRPLCRHRPDEPGAGQGA